MDLEASKQKLADALDANADAAKEAAGSEPARAEAFSTAALKASQALATLVTAGL